MPAFDELDEVKFSGGGIQFSGVAPKALRIGQCTVVGIARDKSSSVKSFEQILIKTSKDAVRGCNQCPQPETLVIRFLDFATTVKEVHGFKQLKSIDVDKDYDMSCGGNTKLRDALYDMVTSVDEYGTQVYDADIDTNAIIFLFTDGEDLGSRRSMKDVKEAIDKLRRNEKIESVLILLVQVNVSDPHIAKYLDEFSKELGLDASKRIEDFTDDEGAKLAGWVSKSVSSQSQSLGTGGPSQVLNI